MDKLYITYHASTSEYFASKLLVLNNQMNREYLSVPINDIHDTIEYNNTLLFFGNNMYCQFDGNSFTTKHINTGITDNIHSNCVVYNGYIYTSSSFGLYRWDINNNIITLVLSSFDMVGQMCVYNNSIYYTHFTDLYKYNAIDNSCTLVSSNILGLIKDSSMILLCTDGYKLYMQSFNGGGDSENGHIENIIARVADYSLAKQNFDNNTVILQRKETGNGKYQTAFADLTKSVSGVNRFISGFDDAWFYSNGGFENCPMYYGNGSQWIKFKN